MADDKKKEGDAKAEDGKKKKGLPPVILVAVGAALGGVGVVFALPPKTVEVKVEEPKHEWKDFQHPDLMEFQFCPRTASGRAYISTQFYFVYRVRDDHVEEAFEAIKANWDRANSRVLDLLGSRTLTELNAENGKKVLAKDMMDEIDATLFPPGKGEHAEKVASVTEVLWKKWVVQ